MVDRYLASPTFDVPHLSWTLLDGSAQLAIASTRRAQYRTRVYATIGGSCVSWRIGIAL